MISKQRRACSPGSSGHDPSGQIGPVPDTSTRSPTRTAREKPMLASNGEPDVTFLRACTPQVLQGARQCQMSISPRRTEELDQIPIDVERAELPRAELGIRDADPGHRMKHAGWRKLGVQAVDVVDLDPATRRPG